MKNFALSLRNKRGGARLALLYGSAAALLLLSFILGIFCGSTHLSLSDALSAIRGGSGTGERIFLYVRLPRVLCALLCGAALAVSGAVIQGVLANRLASPGIIGINSGAGLAVTLCTAFGLLGGLHLSLFAFLGAFTAALFVSAVSKRFGASRGTVILIGVALNSILNAVSDAVITLVPDAAALSADFRIGSFSSVTYSRLLPSALLIGLSLAVLLTLTNELDVMTLGDEGATGLGLNTRVMRPIFLLLAAMLAGAAVSLAGLLSFVGLLVPHAVRRVSPSCSKHIIPLCALFGGGFVAVCDTLARTLFSPYEIPVGIIMAFLGAPFFIFIIIKGKGGHANG